MAHEPGWYQHEAWGSASELLFKKLTASVYFWFPTTSKSKQRVVLGNNDLMPPDRGLQTQQETEVAVRGSAWVQVVLISLLYHSSIHTHLYQFFT